MWPFKKKQTLQELEEARAVKVITDQKIQAKKLINNWEHYLHLTNKEEKVKNRKALPNYWMELKGDEKIRWIVEFLDAEYIKEYKEWL
jgi:hypothetical protein